MYACIYILVFQHLNLFAMFEDFPILCILSKGRNYLLVSRLEVPGTWLRNISGCRAASLSPRLYHADALCHSLESATGVATASGVLSSGHRGNCSKTEFLCDPAFLSLHQVRCMNESFVVRYIPLSPDFPDSEWFWQIIFVLKSAWVGLCPSKLRSWLLHTSQFCHPYCVSFHFRQGFLWLHDSCNCGQKCRQTR